MEHTVSPLLRLLDKDEDPSFDAFLYIGETLVLKAHKYILSLSVPFFERSFRSGMKEAETGEVKFPETKVSKDTLRTLVRSVYGEKMVINETNVRDIHATANFMEMDEVSEKCAEFLLENLKVDTVLPMWEYSLTDFAGSKKLLKGCEEFIAGHFFDLYENENFLNLGVDFMCAFLSLNTLCVSSENDVFDALLCWLNHDWGNRFHLINERSLLDLVRWESIDISVNWLSSLLHIRDEDHDSVEEKIALFMVYEKVIGLPERAKKHLTRVKKEVTPLVPTPATPASSVSSEVGSVYCLRGERVNDVKVHIFDVATEQFRDPQPLDMPERAYHVVGMISHGSRPFVVASDGPQYIYGHCLLLLELQQGRIKSKVDLLLPMDGQIHWDPRAPKFLLAAAPPNADKLCIGLCQDYSCQVVVYDLGFHRLQAPTSEGSLGSLYCSDFVGAIPSSDPDVRFGGPHRVIRIAYTPGKLWAVEQDYTGLGKASCSLKASSYNLSSKRWGNPCLLASGAYKAGDYRLVSDVIVMSEYIAVAVSSYVLADGRSRSQGWVHVFKYDDPINDRRVLTLTCVVDVERYKVESVSMYSMGQRLLVFMHCVEEVVDSRRNRYYRTCHAFSARVDQHGKPTEQLSMEEPMNRLKPVFTLPIQ